jgi:hypothetical protein
MTPQAKSIYLQLVRALSISVSVQLVHLGFLVVVVAEDEPEDDASESGGNADTRVHPHDGGVAGGGNEGLADGGSDGGSEKV